jgi:hypothetical protein
MISREESRRHWPPGKPKAVDEFSSSTGWPTNQQSSHSGPHRKVGQAAMALILYTQQFRVQNRSDPNSLRKV